MTRAVATPPPPPPPPPPPRAPRIVYVRSRARSEAVRVRGASCCRGRRWRGRWRGRGDGGLLALAHHLHQVHDLDARQVPGLVGVDEAHDPLEVLLRDRLVQLLVQHHLQLGVGEGVLDHARALAVVKQDLGRGLVSQQQRPEPSLGLPCAWGGRKNGYDEESQGRRHGSAGGWVGGAPRSRQTVPCTPGTAQATGGGSAPAILSTTHLPRAVLEQIARLSLGYQRHLLHAQQALVELTRVPLGPEDLVEAGLQRIGELLRPLHDVKDLVHLFTSQPPTTGTTVSKEETGAKKACTAERSTHTPLLGPRS
jgi:hypothetical protein